MNVPSGYVKIAIENGPFIVDLPSKHSNFPQLCKRLPEGIFHMLEFTVYRIIYGQFSAKDMTKPRGKIATTFFRKPKRLTLRQIEGFEYFESHKVSVGTLW